MRRDLLGSEVDDSQIETSGDLCSNILTNKACEPLLRTIMMAERGVWLDVRDVCEQGGLSCGGVFDDLRVVWLDDNAKEDGYVVVLFASISSIWSLFAVCNRSKLLEKT